MRAEEARVRGKGEPAVFDGLAEVVPFGRREPRLRRPSVALVVPSTASLVAAVALVASGVGAYLAARETSVFAVRAVQVDGVGPAARDARRLLRAYVDRSLMTVDAAAVERRLVALPTIEGARADRAFPHTLRVAVRGGTPAAVIRRGSHAWLVSTSGQILSKAAPRQRPGLPRIWVGAKTEVAPGEAAPTGVLEAVEAAAALAGRFPARVAHVRAGEDELTFVLRSKFEVRLGDAGDVRLKVEIARRILPHLVPLRPGRYLDVSVPTRPVASTNPQLEG